MSAGAPHATLKPAEVIRALREARLHLTRAQSNCDDPATKQSIARALRAITESGTRAMAVYKDVDLREAEQPPLFPEEGA